MTPPQKSGGGIKTDDAVLRTLRREQTRYISGEDLAQEIGVTRTAIWKAIEGLRELGYEISAHPNAGYRLDGVPDRLYSDEILHGLETEYMGLQVHAYESCDSTNDTGWNLAQQGAPEGTLIVTEKQLKGRGRLGRAWDSPPGQNLLFSIIIRPPFAPDGLGRITLVAAISLVRTIRQELTVAAGIKWPNDIVHQDQKIGGILTEISTDMDRVKFCIVGIGLNLNSDPAALPEGAMSLKKLAGHPIPRTAFLKAFLRVFEKDYETFKMGRFDLLAEDWRQYSETIGRRVTAHLPDRNIEGQALDIDEQGMLWIRQDSGLQEKIMSGDIRHLRAVSSEKKSLKTRKTKREA